MKLSRIKTKAFSLIELSVVILVIGVLISGIMQSRKLSARARLANARGLTVNSPVATLGDLVLWYETTSEQSFSSTEAIDGTAISTWYDLNPNIETVRNNATQTTPGNRPVYKSGVLNNLPAIEFTRANSNYLSIANASGIVNSSYTIFVVEQRTSNVSDNYFIGGSSTTANSNLYLGYYDYTTAVFGQYDNNYSTPYQPYYGKMKIHSYTFNFSQKKYYVDGILQSLNNWYSSPDPAQGLVAYPNPSLGLFTDIAKCYQGYLGEVIIFKKYLAPSDRYAVENYLGKKWGKTMSIY